MKRDAVEPAGLSVAEACRYLSVGQTTLYALLKDQKLASRKLGRRRIILKASLDRLLATLPSGKN